jgi:Cu+-exporting ATPase
MKGNSIDESEIQTEVDVKCTHCGLPCVEQPVLKNKNTFCCQGCVAVYDLLNQNDLCQYYDNEKGLKPETTDVSEFQFLDEKESSSKFVVFSQGNSVQYRFFIPGMHCNSCIYLLERLERLNRSEEHTSELQSPLNTV